jgi:hypothetical protein
MVGLVNNELDSEGNCHDLIKVLLTFFGGTEENDRNVKTG